MQIVDARDHARLSGNPLTHLPQLHKAQLPIALIARYFLSQLLQLAERHSGQRLTIDHRKDQKGRDYAKLRWQRKVA